MSYTRINQEQTLGIRKQKKQYFMTPLDREKARIRKNRKAKETRRWKSLNGPVTVTKIEKESKIA